MAGESCSQALASLKRLRDEPPRGRLAGVAGNPGDDSSSHHSLHV